MIVIMPVGLIVKLIKVNNLFSGDLTKIFDFQPFLYI